MRGRDGKPRIERFDPHATTAFRARASARSNRGEPRSPDRSGATRPVGGPSLEVLSLDRPETSSELTRHLDLIRHAASPLPSSVPSGDAGGVGFATQVSGIFLADAEGILVGHDSGLVAVSGLPAARLVATPVRELLVPVMDGTRHPADIVAEYAALFES